jgi:subtilisin family serine protease
MNCPPEAWLEERQVDEALARCDGSGVKIAIIDSGVETSHPGLNTVELADDWVLEENFGAAHVEPGSGVDLYGHGTAVAAVIHRFAPGAVLGSFRVLNARLGSRNHLIREGARMAIERGYRVLNCSFGCRDEQGRFAMLYKDWLDLAYLRRVHVVTACNNENFNVQEWPGFFNSCINVNMAKGLKEHLAYRADHLVEFSAEGVDVHLPWKDGSYKTVTGSSFAAPVVSGYLARLLEAFPDLTIHQAKALLQAKARRWREDFGHENV